MFCSQNKINLKNNKLTVYITNKLVNNILNIDI